MGHHHTGYVRRLLSIVAVVTAAGATPSRALQTAAPNPSDADLSARIERYLRPLVDAGELSGTVLVAQGDRVLYERSFGMANFELKVPNTPESRFCVASITKPMTAIIARRLIDEKKLSPEDQLAKWIPDFPNAERITVEHLMTHRAGIPHRVTTDEEETRPHTAADMVRFAARQPLVFAPGTQDAYSSAGYSILANILERSSGRSYEQLLEQYVLGPVGASHTTHGDSRALVPNRALSYVRGPSSPVNCYLKDLSFLVGAGSVYSTPRDLLAIARGLVKGVYGQGARQMLVRDAGLRWNGITNGYRAFADYYKDRDLTVIFTGNYFTGAADLLRAALPKIVGGDEVAPATVPQVRPVAMPEAARSRSEGRYELRPGSVETLRFETPTLASLGEWVLIPISTDTFFSPQDYATVKLDLAAEGPAQALLWQRPENTYRFARVKP